MGYILRINFSFHGVFAFLAAVLIQLPVSALAADGEPDRTILPIPQKPFSGVIDKDSAQSRPDDGRPLRAPEGAPNVLIVMTDDVQLKGSVTNANYSYL